MRMGTAVESASIWKESMVSAMVDWNERCAYTVCKTRH